MVKIIKIIISVILVSILVVFPIMVSKYVNFKVDKTLSLNIENPVKEKSNIDYLNMLSLAEQNFQANEENADSAPKQTVLALWALKDTQSILITESNEMINQNYDFSYKLAKNDEVLNSNLITKSNQISIILFYLLLSILLIGSSAILLFIWKAELHL